MPFRFNVFTNNLDFYEKSITTPIGIADGGTGSTTADGAFNNMSPTTTVGDIIVSDGTDNIRLGVGADDQVLTADSSEASGVIWSDPDSFNDLSPLTTKGDVVVHDGTDNTRLGVGTDDQVLTADSTEASGVKWATAGGGGVSPWEGLGYMAGFYYTSPLLCVNGASNIFSISADDINAIPFICTDTTTFDRMGIIIVNGAAAGKSLRLGIYNNYRGKPSTLLATIGTIAADVAGETFVEASCSQELTPGVYWLASHAEADCGVRALYDGNYFMPIETTGISKTAYLTFEFNSQPYASGFPDLTSEALSNYQTPGIVFKLRAS